MATSDCARSARSADGDRFKSKLTIQPQMRWVGLLPSTSAAATLASSSNSMKSGWAVARLPHHNDGAHLPEAGNVLPRLLRTRRDAADYELLAMPGHCRGASTSAAPPICGRVAAVSAPRLLFLFLTGSGSGRGGGGRQLGYWGLVRCGVGQVRAQGQRWRG